MSFVQYNRLPSSRGKYHQSGQSNLKHFSSENVTFLKSTCSVNHLLAHPGLARLCFFVSVIFFLSLCIIQTNPMQRSSYCSGVYIKFTFLLHFSCCNFFSRCQKPCHSPLYSPFSPLANRSFLSSLLFPLRVCLQHVFYS